MFRYYGRFCNTLELEVSMLSLKRQATVFNSKHYQNEPGGRHRMALR